MTIVYLLLHGVHIGIGYMVWLNEYISKLACSDSLVGAKMITGATCLDTWHVNVTPQVWVSQCCYNHQGVAKALLALTPEIKVLRQHKGYPISTSLVSS